MLALDLCAHTGARSKISEIVDEAKKELQAIWDKYSKPLDWLQHTGKIKVELEAWKKKWFGK